MESKFIINCNFLLETVEPCYCEEAFGETVEKESGAGG